MDPREQALIIQRFGHIISSTSSFLLYTPGGCCSKLWLCSLFVAVGGLMGLTAVLLWWRRRVRKRSDVHQGRPPSIENGNDTRHARRASRVGTTPHSSSHRSCTNLGQTHKTKHGERFPLSESDPAPHSTHPSTTSPPPRIESNSTIVRNRVIFHGSPPKQTPEGVVQYSLIFKLPIEILHQIFLDTFPQRETFIVRETLPPFVLRLVCKHWRSVIDEFPSMWRSLRPVLNPRHNQPGQEGILDWYKEVTGRIRFFDDITITLPDTDQVDWSFFQYLLGLSERSKAINIILDGAITPVLNSFAWAPGFIDSHEPCGVPEMKDLRMVRWCMRNPFSSSLSHIRHLPWSSLRFLPWSQLTSINLCLPLSLQDCIFIFGHANLVEDLVLNTVNQYAAETRYPGAIVQLPYLRSLHIDSEFSILNLFEKHWMPKLQTIHFGLGRGADADALHSLNLPWSQLTRIVLRCPLTAGVADGLVGNLNLVETFDWEGDLDAPQSWPSASNRLSSLKSFRLTPNNSDGSSMAGHFMGNILDLPGRVDKLDLPLVPGTIGNDTLQNLNLLQVAILSQPISPSDLFLFLSHTPNLQEGTFNVQEVEESQIAPLPSTSPGSPVLSSTPPPAPLYPFTRSGMISLHLKLGLCHNADPGYFFSCLELPNVNSIIFEATTFSASDCNGLISMLDRSQSPIKQLHLGCFLSEEGAIQCLAVAHTTLEDFKITDNSYRTRLGSPVFLALTHGGTIAFPRGGCLCPRLERFDAPLWVTDINVLRELIESRSDFDNTCGCCNSRVEKTSFVGRPIRCQEVVWGQYKRELKERGITFELEAPYSPYLSD